MILQIVSDLHNEFGVFELDFSDVDILILAGDIDVGEKGFDWISQQVKNIPVLYVLGNHEYYKNAYPKLLNKLKQKAKDSNVHILENDCIQFEDVSFHGATLWTNFELFGNPKVAGYYAQQRMTDYRKIRKTPTYSKLRSLDTHLMHYESVRWLENSLNRSKTSKNVVITHHSPSKKSLPLERQDDIISAAYASDLENFILETKPDLWVHGHIHNYADYHIDKTRVICNPRGYPDEKYFGFNKKLTVEI